MNYYHVNPTTESDSCSDEESCRGSNLPHSSTLINPTRKRRRGIIGKFFLTMLLYPRVILTQEYSIIPCYSQSAGFTKMASSQFHGKNFFLDKNLIIYFYFDRKATEG